MTLVNKESSKNLSEQETDRLKQDFQVSQEIEAQLEDLAQKLHAICVEHEIPLVLSAVLQKHSTDDGCSVKQVSAASLPGARANSQYRRAVRILEGSEEDLLIDLLQSITKYGQSE